MKTFSKLYTAFMEAYDGPLEDACEAVMSLGWEPKDCLVENYPSTSRRVLKVAGEPVFEVTVGECVCEEDQYSIPITARWLTVPKTKPSAGTTDGGQSQG